MHEWKYIQECKNYGASSRVLLNMIIEDIFEHNFGPNKKEKPTDLFVGTIRRDEDFVRNIFPFEGSLTCSSSSLENPYTKLELRVIKPKDFSPSSEINYILFYPGLGRLKKPSELFTFTENNWRSFNSNSNHEDIYSKLTEDKFLKPKDRKFIDLIQAQKVFPDQLASLKKIYDENCDLYDAITDELKMQNKRHDELVKQQGEHDNKLKVAEEEAARLKKEIQDVKKRIEDKQEELKGDKERLEAYHRQLLEAYHRHFSLVESESSEGENPAEFDLDLIKKRLQYNYDNNNKLILDFLMALSTTQIVALCGKPGTGKTTFVEQMAKALGAKFTSIEVQNNWTDRSDLLGYYSPLEGGRYFSTEFLDALIAARDETYVADIEKRDTRDTRLHIICLDEMNLARVEYYFATFLSLMQRGEDERVIKLLPSEVSRRLNESESAGVDNNLIRYHDFRIPENVRFVGTMNMDETAQFLSPKVIDRCFFIEMDGKTASDKNTKYDLDETIYCPSGSFETKCEPGNAGESVVPKELEYLNVRTKTYIEQMWEAYKQWLKGGDSPNESSFLDRTILAKVLPAAKTREELSWLEESDDYSQAKERYKTGCERGDKLHSYDSESWSFWE